MVFGTLVSLKMALLYAGFALAPLPAETATRPERNSNPRRQAAAPPSASRPAAAANTPDHKAREMVIGFHINTIDDINWNTSTFRADLYWWVRYPMAESEDPERIEALEFTNKVEVEEHQTWRQERKNLHASNEVYASYRTIARFHFDSDFRKYPFDKQRFLIVMEHETFPSTDLVLKDDETSYSRSGVSTHLWGLAESVRIPDLEIRQVSRDFSDHEYKTDFGDPTAQKATRFSRVVLSVEVERKFTPYLVKIIIPLLIILILAYLVFFVPAQNLEVAVGLTVTSVLACIAIQLTLSDRMPNVGYLITSDRIFHLCYFLIMLAMAETVITFNLAKNGKAALSTRIESLARVAFPAAFLLGLLLIVAHALSR